MALGEYVFSIVYVCIAYFVYSVVHLFRRPNTKPPCVST